MNVFLRFKRKTHLEGYSHSLLLQVQKQITMLCLSAITMVTGLVILVAISRNPSSSLPKIFMSIRILIIIISLITLCYLRQNILKVSQTRVYLLNLTIDLLLILIQFIFYPAVEVAVIETHGKFGVYVMGWATALGCCAIYFIVINWWLRALAPVVQAIYFFVFLPKNDVLPAPVYVFSLLAVCLFSLCIYFHEKYLRRDFLEKRKAYENHEAMKKIFEDIIQGVVIIDQKYKIIYANQAINTMFNRPKTQMEPCSSFEGLFSEIIVKAVSSRLETVAGEENICLQEGGMDRERKLDEVLPLISKILFHPTFSEPSVTAETYWCNPLQLCLLPQQQRPQKKRNFFMKFTTSLFMDKQVIILNITDTTDRDALLLAQASSEYKSRLLSSISHELRTPLNGSINFIEQTLCDPTIPNTPKEKWLLPALRSNRLLLSLVNDILDFSQMHAGKLRLVFGSGNVYAAAKECTELLEIQANKKGLKLVLRSNLTPESETLVTDHNRLRQVILNLLSNAIKFTFNGVVSLTLDPATVKIAPQDQQGTESELKGVRVTCRDSGVGINEQNQKRIAQAIEEIEFGKKIPINAPGIGLGLLISNNLVRRLNSEGSDFHQSKIRFISKENEGSCFFFEVFDKGETKTNYTHQYVDLEEYKSGDELAVSFEKGLENLKVEQLSRQFSFGGNIRERVAKSMDSIETKRLSVPTQQPTTHASLPSLDINCKCPKILIVDDDPFNLTALEQILSKLRISCSWAFNGVEAITKVLNRHSNRCCAVCQQFKVIFLDISMPVMDGFETARRLRQMIQNGEIDDLKIIACTAFIQQADEDRAKEAGMDEFCTKPINFKAIKQQLYAVGFLERV